MTEWQRWSCRATATEGPGRPRNPCAASFPRSPTDLELARGGGVDPQCLRPLHTESESQPQEGRRERPMPNTPAGMRQCPTRADGTHALFAHVIAPSTCQERQRGFYHKCPSCSFYNLRARNEPA